MSCFCHKVEVKVFLLNKDILTWIVVRKNNFMKCSNLLKLCSPLIVVIQKGVTGAFFK